MVVFGTDTIVLAAPVGQKQTLIIGSPRWRGTVIAISGRDSNYLKLDGEAALFGNAN